jgi:hypothetical protein
MRFDPSLELKVRQTFDEGDALDDIRKLLSGPPQQVVKLLVVGGVSQRALRKQ